MSDGSQQQVAGSDAVEAEIIEVGQGESVPSGEAGDGGGAIDTDREDGDRLGAHSIAMLDSNFRMVLHSCVPCLLY